MDETSDFHPLRQLRNLFITGLLVLVPLGTTIMIVYKLFDLADRNVREMLTPHFDALATFFFGKTVPIPPYGIGLVVTVLVIMGVGILAKNLIGRRIITFLESLLLRIPFISRIYLAIKQISEAFLERKKSLFHEVVLIEYPRKGIYSLGFVTSEAPSVFDRLDGEAVCIFVSTTPNPTSGVLVIVPRSDVIPLNISVEDGMKMVISGGVVVPERLYQSSAIKSELDNVPKPETRPDSDSHSLPNIPPEL